MSISLFNENVFWLLRLFCSADTGMDVRYKKREHIAISRRCAQVVYWGSTSCSCFFYVANILVTICYDSVYVMPIWRLNENVFGLLRLFCSAVTEMDVRCKKRAHIAISRRCARVVLASWGKARQLSQIRDYEHKSWNIVWLCGYDKMRRSQDLDGLHKAWRQKNPSVDIEHTILINHSYRIYVLTSAHCSNTAHTSSDDTYLWVTV